MGSDPCNLFTVDLEEWFHVCGVGGPLAPSNWDRLPARVEPTTLALLEMLDRRHVVHADAVAQSLPTQVAGLLQGGLAAAQDVFLKRLGVPLGQDSELGIHAGPR